jgi:hypothetical protein
MKFAYCYRRACLAFLILLALSSASARAQTEIIFGPISADPQFVFAHTSLPGATGINFSFFGAFAGAYPPEDLHTAVITFEWGPTATGPWSTSPDFINTVPGAMTDFYMTGVYPGPEDAPFVAIHFFADALITVSGEFTHTSTVAIPEPASIGIALCALASVFALRR